MYICNLCIKGREDSIHELSIFFKVKFPAIKLYMNEVLLHCRKGRQGKCTALG